MQGRRRTSEPLAWLFLLIALVALIVWVVTGGGSALAAAVGSCLFAAALAAGYTLPRNRR